MRFASSSMVYYNTSLRYAIDDLHGLGYDGIEIWAGRPHMYRGDLDDEMESLRDLLTGHGMEVCNLIPAQYRYPSILCSDDEKIRADSVAYVKTAVDNAEAIGSPSISLCPGMVLFDRDAAVGRKRLLRSFREIEEYAEGRNVLLLIEPAHRFESNLIRTIDECIEIIDELGSDRFGILLDTGHCHVNGESFAEAVPKCRDFPLHVHLDDNSGESDSHLLPGEGTADLSAFAEALEKIGYRGFVSAELGMSYIMDPHGASEAALKKLGELFGRTNGE